MASLIARPVRSFTSRICTQYPRPPIPAWQTSQRKASTVATPSAQADSSSIPPKLPNKSSSHTLSQVETRKSSTSHNKPGSEKLIVASVSKAGFMDKTVRVTMTVDIWDKYLRKYYKGARHLLVHDPANSLREGDMIHVRTLAAQKTDTVRHVVHEILVPFGVDIADRPPVPSREELEVVDRERLAEKLERRLLRAKAKSGDDAAEQKVQELGIGVREVVTGRGRSRRVRTLLEKDVVKGKK